MPCLDCLDAARALVPAWVSHAPLWLALGAGGLTLVAGAAALWLGARHLGPAPAEAPWTERARAHFTLRALGASSGAVMAAATGATLAYTGPFGVPGPAARVALGVALPLAAGLCLATLARRRWRRHPWRSELRAAATRALLLSPLAAAPLVGLALPARLAPGTVPWAVLGAAVCAFFAVGGGVLFGRALGLLRPAGARLRGAVAAPARPGGRAVRLYEAPLLQANAFALPLLRTVIVTRPALDALDDDELAATCRHELEHLDEPRAVALARFGIAWGVGLALASVRQVHAAAGLAGLGGTLLVLVALGALHTRLGRAMEARADRGGHDHGPAYARALEKLYAWNLVPAVLPRKMLHGHLYDRLLAAGVTPGYPRPAPPVRARGPLLLVVAVALGAVVALFVLREAATRPGEESEATALRALALRGDHHALGALAYVRLAAGAAEDALTLLRAAEELAPEEPFYPLTQARILAAADACEPARDLAARAAELGAPGHEIRIALAPCPTRAPERLVSATFARAEPPGREARVFFTVTNLGDRPIETLFSVAYYYDRAGRLLRRTPPFSADEDLGAHETREIALDWVAAMPRTAAIAEAEIDEVRFADGGRWHNAALTPERRPRGGVAPR